MNRIIFLIIAVLFSATCSLACEPCGTCVDGKDGINGIDGKDGIGIQGPMGPKGDKGDTGYSLAGFKKDRRAIATDSGILASTRIDHAKNGGMALGIGVAGIDDGAGVSVGFGKSIQRSGAVKEIVLDVAAFFGASSATEAAGVSSAVTAHF